MQLTLRGLSPELEAYLQKLATEENISLNKAALKVLAKGAGLTENKKKRLLVRIWIICLVHGQTQRPRHSWNRSNLASKLIKIFGYETVV